MKADMEGLNASLVELLQKRGLHISTAESCTGGLLSALITEVSGASDVFNETIVTYSNEAKMREISVKQKTLDKFGAVSRHTAKEMAFGICARTGADIGVGITGIAGPGGGTPEKPVGTVFVGISICGEMSVYHLLIGGGRNDVREETCRFVFKTLCDKLRKETVI